MAKIGRPKNNIETKRIQCVIPKDLLDKLDLKVRVMENKDRSKAITQAVSEWLGITKKKTKFENIYYKLFGFSDTTLKNELFLNSNIKKENSVIVKAIDELISLLIMGETISQDKLSLINGILKQCNIYLDKNFKLNCDSNAIINFIFVLLLNYSFPVNNYLGICKYCGKEFFKKRSGQKYCSSSCKLKHFYETRNKSKDPYKYMEITDSIDRIRSKAEKQEIYFDNYGYNSEIQRYKDIIYECCIIAENKYSKLKNLLKKNILAYDNQIIRSIIILMNEIILLLLKKDYEVIENLTRDDFLSFMVETVFPENCGKNIKRNAIKDLRIIIPISRFNIEKDLLLAYKRIELLKNDNYAECADYYRKAVINSKQYFLTQFDDDYKNVIEDKTLFYVQKYLNIQLADLRLADELFTSDDLDEAIEICKNILKKNPISLDAYGVLIHVYFYKRDYESVIRYYERIERISPYLNLLNNNKINSQKRYKKEIMAIRRVTDLGLIKGQASFAYWKNGCKEIALNIIKADEFFVTNKAKIRRLKNYCIFNKDENNLDKAKEILLKLKELGANTDDIGLD